MLMQEHCYIITSDSKLKMWAKSIEGRKPLVSWVFLLWEMYYEWDECNNQQRDGWNVCLDVEEEKTERLWRMKNEFQGEDRQRGG